MKISAVLNAIESLAPFSLSDKFVELTSGYDNSGVIASIGDDITGVVFTLDLTFESVERAISEGANLIVTHHPAIYAPIKSVEGALLSAINNKIGVISTHLNLDCAKEGIDYCLANGLGAKEQTILTKVCDGCGYGRVFDVDTTVLELVNRYKTVFETQNVMVFGGDKKVKKVASFCGSGLDISEINSASEADVFVSSDIKHHVILHALEMGKSVLNVSHYTSEVYGFKVFYNKIKEQLNGLNCVFVENKNMI